MNTATELKTSTETYRIYYDNKAFRWLEEKTGRPFLELNYKSMRDLTVLLWAGLLRYHPQATVETADEVLDALGYEEAMNVVVRAAEQSPPFRQKSAGG